MQLDNKAPAFQLQVLTEKKGCNLTQTILRCRIKQPCTQALGGQGEMSVHELSFVGRNWDGRNWDGHPEAVQYCQLSPEANKEIELIPSRTLCGYMN